MSGNMQKWARNRRGAGGGRANVGEAVTIEGAAEAINHINYRKKRDRRALREQRIESENKAKITLPKVTFGKGDPT